MHREKKENNAFFLQSQINMLITMMVTIH